MSTTSYDFGAASTAAYEAAKSATGSVAKSLFGREITLAITLIIFLIIVIVTGKILHEINKSKCFASGDQNILVAHKWCAWAVGISSTGMALTLILFLVLLFA